MFGGLKKAIHESRGMNRRAWMSAPTSSARAMPCLLTEGGSEIIACEQPPQTEGVVIEAGALGLARSHFDSNERDVPYRARV
jgi:hypothetical protein